MEQIEEFIRSVSFSDEKERKNCLKYLELKGVAQHTRIRDCLKNINEDEKITYASVSSLYRYDKRLRDTLYIYLSTVEEWTRSKIGNGNRICEEKFPKTKKSVVEKFPLIMESWQFRELFYYAKTVCRDIFQTDENLDKNIDALCELRNAVSHHKFLLTLKLKECCVGSRVGSELKINIENLQSFLPDDFKNGFAKAINDCAINKRKEELPLQIPDIFVINI